MNTEIIQLSQLVENPDNPRHITERSLQRLITSILVFPKMLSLRPIVVDETMTALGGNMRLRALSAIATFSPEQIAAHLQGSQDYEEKTPAEREALIHHWRKWLEHPTVEIAHGSTLSEEEKRAFIIKDNVAFGTWDTQALTEGWDTQQLEAWNVDLNWGDAPSFEDNEEDETEGESWDNISADDFEDDFSLPSGEKGDTEIFRTILSIPQSAFVRECLKKVVVDEADTLGNQNKNGNALYSIVRQWDAAKTSSSK